MLSYPNEYGDVRVAGTLFEVLDQSSSIIHVSSPSAVTGDEVVTIGTLVTCN
jgi:hypothetical protein